MISSKDITEGHINLVDHDTLKRIIRDVLKDVASVKSTLGPGGKANLVHDSNNTSLYQSKDGYRIVMDMHYDDYFYDAILKLIKDASAHNNAIIGDGTTSAEVILEKFYTNLEDLVEKHEGGFEHISLTGVVNILETLKGVLKEELISKGYVRFLKDYPVEEQKKKAAEIEASKKLLAALIFCEAGNQPYKGQVAVGAVVMNRIASGKYPNSMKAVIYQRGQFGPASTGKLDRVLRNGSYTATNLQAAEDALKGVDPVEGCLYFGCGKKGIKIGAHYFH